MHRWLLGISDPIIQVDHENGNSLDNQRLNIRVADSQKNTWNTKRVSKRYRYTGIWLNHDKWSARVMKDGHDHYLGSFDSDTDAARAYDKKARELFGEFACVNFPHRKREKGMNGTFRLYLNGVLIGECDHRIVFDGRYDVINIPSIRLDNHVVWPTEAEFYNEKMGIPHADKPGFEGDTL